MSIVVSEDFMMEVAGLLSGNLVDVELEENDIDLAYRMAKRTWKQKGNDNLNQSIFKLDVIGGQNEYTLPDEVTDVSAVYTMKGSSAISAEDPFSMAAFQETYTHGLGSGSGDYFYIYDLTMQLAENNRMYLADEPNFSYNRRTKTLYVFNPPKTDTTWVLDVYRESTDEEYQEQLWILNWTVAECKKILGRAYRKFGSLPSPTGESQIDGDQLVQEGIREQEMLIEDIEHFVDGDPDGMGVWMM